MKFVDKMRAQCEQEAQSSATYENLFYLLGIMIYLASFQWSQLL